MGEDDKLRLGVEQDSGRQYLLQEDGDGDHGDGDHGDGDHSDGDDGDHDEHRELYLLLLQHVLLDDACVEL